MGALTLLLLFSTSCIAAAQPRYSNISRGSWLTPTATNNSSWLSPSGVYAFGFYPLPNGYAVGVFVAGVPEKAVVWTANRDNPLVSSNTTLLFTNDGRLVLRLSQGQDMSLITVEPASSASMLDSGNFVLYNSDQQITWQSFDYPTDTLLPGQRLPATKELFSSSSVTNPSTGIFRLIVQQDGWLVQYPAGAPSEIPYAYWTKGISGAGSNVSLNLDDDAHLYLFNSTDNIFNITEGGYPKEKHIYRMKIEADGILRLYSNNPDQQRNWSIIWSSSSDKCDPKGICGLNAYCVLVDDDVDCRCLPGYDFVSPGNWTAGCERISMVGSCQNEGINYTMFALDSTVFLDNYYSVLSVNFQEDCEKACLNNCGCEAAVFKDRQCKMQGLPLRYGRRDLKDSNIALIKLGTYLHTDGVPANNDMTKPKKEIHKGILILGVSLLAFSFFVLATTLFLIHKTKIWAYKKVQEIRSAELDEDFAPRTFTYAELLQATNGFKEELGRGACGIVYKGIISNTGEVVAVKRLEKVIEEGEKEFQNEMKAIGKTHHRNLIRLLGYCIDKSNRHLVFEYMSNGSLADLLYTSENGLSWDNRIRIAVDIARGILYLHEECEKQIIHCDIKPQNILMDEFMRAKISDFGLAKLLKRDQTQTFTGIRGTRGYVAPEWHKKFAVTVKADVYSFGIVLFEIICHRKSVDWSLSEDEAVLEEWVYSCFQAAELGRLIGDDQEVDKRKFERMVKIGIWCIQDEPSLRPSMKKVLLMLEGTVEIPVPPNPSSFLSSIEV